MTVCLGGAGEWVCAHKGHPLTPSLLTRYDLAGAAMTINYSEIKMHPYIIEMIGAE